ncbi:MAG: dihydrolipoamide acetyltransferase family protein [Bdellovibrionota bacterium]
MAIEITMPQLSDTMHEGKILNWKKQEGDSVKRGDALAEVATDKADLEIESFHEGTLVKILAQTGTMVKVGTVIAIVGDKGEQPSAAPQAQAQPAPQPAPVTAQPAPQPAPAPVAAAPAPQPTTTSHSSPSPQTNGHAGRLPTDDDDRIKISPLAKSLAKTHGVDYAALSGTGDGGRIVKRDIERALGHELPGSSEPEQSAPRPAPAAPQPAPAARAEAPRQAPSFQSSNQRSTEPLTKMRQAIASRMVEATTTIPHFYATTKVQVDALAKLKQSLKPLPQYEGLTYNHLILKAAALSLRAIPRINASYSDGNLIQPQSVNIGIVTAVQDGLLIPVLKNADQLPLADIVAEGRGLVQRARSGRPKPDDLVGGTFSISNMGMFDVESFTAIISPGQGAILAVAPIQQEAVVVDGELRVGSVMRLTVSVDHRIIDGVVAGEFLTELKRLLQDPVLLLA